MDGLTFVFMGFEVVLISIDALNRIFLLAFAVVGLGALAYIHAMTRDFKHTLLSVSYIGASAGCVAAGDFFSFLVFWELMLVTSTILVVYDRKPESFEAGFRYLLLHVLAGVSLLVAVIIQYVVAGHMGFAVPVAGAFPFFVLACAIKGAMLPFHLWVPDAYSNAMPASSVVLSAFTTKVGVYAVARILGGTIQIAYMGGAMAIFGVIMALAQTNLRRLLSFSIVSKVGYMMAGMALGTIAGTDAGTLHVFNHIMYKTLLFMVAVSVWYRTDSDNVKDLGGLARAMPVTFVCGLVGALSISGMPPFNGFVSKAMLDAAIADLPLLGNMLLFAAVGTAMAFSKFIWYTFLGGEEAAAKKVQAAPLSLRLPMIYLAAVCTLSGVAYGRVAAFLPGSTFMTVYQPAKVIKSSVVVLGGVGLFFLIRGLIDVWARLGAVEPEKLISSGVERFAAVSNFLSPHRQGEAVNLLVVAVAAVGLVLLFW